MEDDRPWFRHWPWAALVLILLAMAALRWRLLDIPLNRDEGEPAYIAQLLLQRVAPYAEAYSMRPPGIYAAYALILALFGPTHVGVHLGLLATSAGSQVLVFLLARRLFDPPTGLVAAAAFGILPLNPTLLGFAAYPEHFVVPFALGGILALLAGVERRHGALAFTGGLILGIGVLMKQSGIWFVLFAVAYALVAGGRPGWWKALIVASGAALPVAVTLLGLLAAGVLGKFWFWTITYASEYVTARPLAMVPGVLWETARDIAAASPVVLGLAGLGLLAPWWDEAARARQRVVLALVAVSLLSTSVGFYFRPQYFVLALPALALLVGVAARALGRRAGRPACATLVALVVGAVAIGVTILRDREFLFQLTPFQQVRLSYHANPFVEALEVARYLQRHTAETDRIAIMGSEPEIYFYANRKAATGFVYMYPLMERHRYARAMQEEMIRQVEASDPAFLVMVWVDFSWMASAESQTLIFDWFERYRRDVFERVGIVEIQSFDRTEYRWGREAVGHTPRSPYWLEVLKRKAAVR